jgi:uncharacterized membrane protein
LILTLYIPFEAAVCIAKMSNRRGNYKIASKVLSIFTFLVVLIGVQCWVPFTFKALEMFREFSPTPRYEYPWVFFGTGLFFFALSGFLKVASLRRSYREKQNYTSRGIQAGLTLLYIFFLAVILCLVGTFIFFIGYFILVPTSWDWIEF